MKNKLTFLLSILSIISIQSQCRLIYGAGNNAEHISFLRYAKPSLESDLSIFLKKYVNEKELKLVTAFNTAPNTVNTIRARISVKKTGGYGFRLYIGNRALSDKLERLLTAYINKKFPELKGKYRGFHYLQLFSKKGGQVVIDASSNVVSDQPPTFKPCKKIKFFLMNDCLGESLYVYFEENIDNYLWENELKKIFERVKIDGHYRTSRLFLSLEIDQKGQIVGFTTPNTISVESRKAINNALLNYSKQNSLKPAYRNGMPLKCTIQTRIYPPRKKIETPQFIIEEKENNKLTQHFRKVFGQSISKNLGRFLRFSYAAKGGKVFFTFRKDGSIDNIWTNAIRSTKENGLDAKLKRLINEEFLNEYKIDRSIDMIYSIVFVRRINKVFKIICDNKIKRESIGIYSECKKCENIKDLKTHNEEVIAKEYIQQFKSKYSNSFDVKINQIKASTNRTSFKQEISEKKFKYVLSNMQMTKELLVFAKSMNDQKKSISEIWNQKYGIGEIDQSDLGNYYSRLMTDVVMDISKFEKTPTINGKVCDYTLKNYFFIQLTSKK